MKLTLKCVLAAILLLLSFAAPVAAGPIEDASVAHGKGDYATALRLIRPLADQGDPRAQHALGFMYGNGHGVPQNDAEALKWYRLAADQSNPRAQSGLGAIYADGKGDYVTAYMWFTLSAAQGYQNGIRNRDKIAERMTPAQLGEAQKLAREWKPTTQPPR